MKVAQGEIPELPPEPEPGPAPEEVVASLEKDVINIMLAQVKEHERRTQIEDAMMLAQAELYEMMLGG